MKRTNEQLLLDVSGRDHGEQVQWEEAIYAIDAAREEGRQEGEVRATRCECSEDEACKFVRERDAALAAVEALLSERGEHKEEDLEADHAE